MLAARKKAPVVSARRPLFTSLKAGMQQMIDALVTRLPPNSLVPGAPVNALSLREDGWAVSAGTRSDHFDAVILAVPAGSAATLLSTANPELASELREIRYSSSITVNLVYGGEVRSTLPPGFGFLVPRSEGKRLLAATFVHNKFPHRAPPDRALIRCFLGGATDEPVLELSEAEISTIVRNELHVILGLASPPVFVRVSKWRKAMAQYGVGHLERLDRIERLCKRLPALALAGNAYRGIGVPDCVRSGTQAASQMLKLFGFGPAPVENRVSHAF
jgi:oxygen-dependent protoporphyrinogen oxidase